MAKRIFAYILIALVIVFVLQNIQVVEFRFLFWKVSMTRALMFFATFLVGIMVGWLARKPKPKARRDF